MFNKYFVLIVCMLLSAAVYSDVRSNVDGRVSYSDSEDTYLIKIADPDGNGVSDNYFYEFSPGSSKVVVLNISANPASTIILRANKVRTHGELSLLGAKSSVLVQADYIECFACSFDKMDRLTLYTGQAILNNRFSGILYTNDFVNDNEENIGLLRMVDPHFKSVSVVELVATRPELSGKVNANQNVASFANGAYEVTPDGLKELGDTALYMFFGRLKYDYNNKKLMYVYNSYPTYKKSTKLFTTRTVSKAIIDANITAAEIKITAQYGLDIKGKIAAGADILAATQIEGRVFSPKPSLSISSIRSNVDVSGDLYSDGDLSIMSFEPLFLNSTARVRANKKVELISKERVKNWGEVAGNNIEVAGHGVINQGRIHAEYWADVWSSENINNQFGGAILGEQVKIVANNGQVVNGSFSYYGGGLNLNAPLGSREYLDLYDGGIHASVEPPAMGFELESNASANISGKRVYVDARDFFNVNPIWTDVDYSTYETGQIDLTEDPEITLKTEYFNRVRVAAAQMLQIAADNYLINSSAQLVVNDVSGQMKLEGNGISNERFRSLNLFSKVFLGNESQRSSKYGSSIWYYYRSKNISTAEEVYAVLPRVYSPPGYIRSNGSLKVSGASDYFVNNFSQLWVEKNADFGSGVRVTDVGIELGAIETGRFFYEYGISSYSLGSEVTGKSGSAQFIKPLAQRSVFNVGGTLRGDIVKTTLKNPMSDYLAEATESYYEDVVDGETVSQTRRRYRIRCGYKTCKRYHTDSYLADGMLDSNAEELGLLGEGDLLVDTIYTVDTNVLVEGSRLEESEEVREFSVSTLDVLAHYWEETKQTVVEFVQNVRAQLASLI